ncbi:hypothetical protein ACQUQU_03090 [Thalassolituus sp. LLYu03]|uniref:hypothetical protein n=1 Tax=Thalassolituus sp. LLYu03 TaxID=3421656 RepID=UPI003D2E8CA9
MVQFYRHLFLLSCLWLTQAPASVAAGLTVGVETTDYAPYYFINNNQYSGEARQLLDDFADKNGLSFYYDAMPVPRLFLLFTRDQFDFKFPDNPQWSSGLKSGLTIYYSDPVMKITEAVMTLTDNTGPIRTVGTILGFTTPGISYQLTEGNLILVEASTMEQLFRMLEAGRIDAIYFNVRVAEYASSHREEPLALKVREEYAPYSYAYYLSTMRHPEVINRFNRYLRSLPPDSAFLPSAMPSNTAQQ